MIKKAVFVILLMVAGNMSGAATHLPPPFIIKMIIRHATGVLQGSEMIISNNGKQLKLRMSKKYEIFNKKSKLVLKGTGKEIDISELVKGKYTIRFDGDANQVESFEKNDTTER
ncbi:MAG: hypothetical protein ACHQF2_05425 [Flavobacteriales bacterium]